VKPLDSLVVLDLTRLLPGALLTQSLANFGAEVCKVEVPGEGDHARSMAPFIDGVGACFYVTNCGKKSLALNLKHEEGKDALLRLVAKADILVEGFRPGVMERLDLGYDRLSSHNPRLIYVALTGYGQDGPYAQKPGHDLNYVALAGVLSPVNSNRPAPPTVQLADVAGAQQALTGILLALLSRQNTARGQKIDVSLFESALSFLTVPLAEIFANDKREISGLLSGKYACYNIYETSDGRLLALGALEEKFWHEFCNTAGCSSLISQQFSHENQDGVISQVAALFKTKTAADWLSLFEHVDTCLTPVNEVSALLQDPHVAARRTFMHSETGLPVLDAFPRLDRTPGSVRGRPPRLGEHTREILARHGFSDEQISDLAIRGIVQLAD
jgi:alpha-methylacyl-CoA racemase